MYRFVKAAADLVLSSSNIQASTLLGEASRGLHSSLLRLQDQSVQSTEEFDTEEPIEQTQNRSYRDSVMLVGDIASEPFPLYRDGELTGYKMKIMTLRRIRDKAGNFLREIPSYHEAVCHRKKCFPLIENKLKVNDQIVIHGRLSNAVSQNLEEITYRTVLKINDVHAINES